MNIVTGFPPFKPEPEEKNPFCIPFISSSPSFATGDPVGIHLLTTSLIVNINNIDIAPTYTI